MFGFTSALKEYLIYQQETRHSPFIKSLWRQTLRWEKYRKPEIIKHYNV